MNKKDITTYITTMLHAKVLIVGGKTGNSAKIFRVFFNKTLFYKHLKPALFTQNILHYFFWFRSKIFKKVFMSTFLT